MWLVRCPSAAQWSLLRNAQVSCVAASTISDALVFSDVVPEWVVGAWGSGNIARYATASGTDANTLPGSTTVALAASCNPSDASPVRLSSVCVVGASFLQTRSLTRTELIGRILREPGAQSLASSSLPVTITPTQWPLWDDVIVVSQAGMLRSVRLGATVNASRHFADRLANLNSSIDELVSTASLVLSATTEIWGDISLKNGSLSDDANSVTDLCKSTGCR